MSKDIFEKALLDLISESEKIISFQNSGYSFEEWVNWELYYIFKKQEVQVNPKPKMGSKFGDLQINHNGETVIIETKIIYDTTQDKWINTIEQDRIKLAAYCANAPSNVSGLQLILLASSHPDIKNIPGWSQWLEKISFWPTDADYDIARSASHGFCQARAWRISPSH